MRGADRLLSRLQGMPSVCRLAADRALSQSADAAWIRAKEAVPVRTGHLRSTLQRHTADQHHRVTAGCSYALFVEKGTRHMRARPYLSPAFHQAKDLARVIRAFREAIR